MSQSRRFFDWTNFTDNRSAYELFNDMVVNGFDYDSYSDKEVFQAIALETAYNLTPIEAAGYGGTTNEATGNKEAAFIFKARIISENSPHSFLPDPCFLMDAGNKGAAIAAIKQHTTFVGYNDSTTKSLFVVNAGDIVEVEMHKGVFSYNLQQGNFLRIAQRGPARTFNGASCQKIADHFGTLPPMNMSRGSTRGPRSSAPVSESPTVASDNMTFSNGVSLSADDPNIVYFYPGVGYGTQPFVAKIIEEIGVPFNTIVILGKDNKTPFSSLKQAAEAEMAGLSPASVKLGGWSGGAKGLTSAIKSGESFDAIIYADPEPGPLMGQSHTGSKMYYNPANWKGDLASLGEQQSTLANEMVGAAHYVTLDHDQILRKSLEELFSIET